MNKLQFIFGLHDHQPVGNFDGVFADAYEKAYMPFLDLLEVYPGFRVCLHHTGPLLLWIAENRPDYLERLGVLVERGQVELLGGAFYEAILPIIPERDRIGQINMMSNWIERVFGVRPRGMWLAERVWEPTLPTAMHAAGIEYSVLDDSHFKSVGLKTDETLGYYLTEDAGHSVSIFPINEVLRYKIPYSPTEEAIDYLRDLAVRADDFIPTAVMADDGEKFGVWPDSFWYCYQEGWMYRFAELATNNKSWLKMKHFSEIMDENPPIDRVYLPTASYMEMMEWAMPPKSILEYKQLVEKLKSRGEWESDKVYVRAGFWRSFLSKYSESNHIQKKMLRVSRKLDMLSPAKKKSKKYSEALDHLWQGQCNCAYWHGVFGGLYLSNIRTALYENLIKSERIVDTMINKGKNFVVHEAEDFDVDGGVELLIDTPAQNVIVQPHMGGMVIEHDVKQIAFNLHDTLMRRLEAYHEEVLRGEGQTKQENLAQFLAEDFTRRGAFIDHFLMDETTPASMQMLRYQEAGDFLNAPYHCSWEKTDFGTMVKLERTGIVETHIGRNEVKLEKVLTFGSNSTKNSVVYRLTNIDTKHLRVRFGVEFNINLLAGDAPDRYHEINGKDLGTKNKMNSIGEVKDVDTFRVIDGWLGLKVEWQLTHPASHWRFPIETVSNSEAGIERIYQGTVIMPVWDVDLKPGEEFEVGMDYLIECSKKR